MMEVRYEKMMNAKYAWNKILDMGKIEISAIWQKFLAPEISGRRNFCHVAEIIFFSCLELNSKQLLQS